MLTLEACSYLYRNSFRIWRNPLFSSGNPRAVGQPLRAVAASRQLAQRRAQQIYYVQLQPANDQIADKGGPY